MTREQIEQITSDKVNEHEERDRSWKIGFSIVIIALMVICSVLAIAVYALVADVRAANDRQDRGACVLVHIIEQSAHDQNQRLEIAIRNARAMPVRTPAQRAVRQRSIRQYRTSRDNLHRIAAQLRENVECPSFKSSP